MSGILEDSFVGSIDTNLDREHRCNETVEFGRVGGVNGVGDSRRQLPTL